MEDNMMNDGMEEEKKKEGTGEMPEGTEEAGEKEEAAEDGMEKPAEGDHAGM